MRGHSSSPPGYTNQTTTPQRDPLLHILILSSPFDSCESYSILISYQSLPTGVPDDRLKLRVTIDQKYQQQVSSSKEIIEKREKLASAVKLSSDAGSKARDVNLPTTAHSTSQGSRISQKKISQPLLKILSAKRKSTDLFLRFGQNIISHPQVPSCGHFQIQSGKELVIWVFNFQL